MTEFISPSEKPEGVLHRVSASGKVILAGEYAVLEGSPCLVMAVNRRLVIDFIPAQPGQLHIDALGLDDANASFVWQGGGWQMTAGLHDARFTLLHRLFEFLSETDALHAILLQGWNFTIDSRQLFDSGHKLGLGSSAALTVSLISGLWHILGKRDANREQQWQHCFLAHNHAQEKTGSGADIASALCGGVTCFHVQQGQAQMRPWSVPANLQLQLFWSGKSAHTPTLLGKLDRWRQGDPDTYHAVQSQMNEVMTDLALQTTSAIIIPAMKDFTQLLHQLDTRARIGIFSHGHDVLWQQSAMHNDLLYKPCGAGGGDLGLALTTCQDSLDTFTEFAQQHGSMPVDLTVDSGGVHVH